MMMYSFVYTYKKVKTAKLLLGQYTVLPKKDNFFMKLNFGEKWFFSN